MLTKTELLVIRRQLLSVLPSQGRSMAQLNQEFRLWQESLAAIDRELAVLNERARETGMGGE
jgi:hypothetical protein